MRINLVAATALAFTVAQPAYAEWQYAPAGEFPTYWSTDVRRDGDSAEFSSFTLIGLGQAGGVLVQRKTVHVDCAWGTGRKSWSSTDRPLRMAEKQTASPRGWERSEFLGDPQNPATAAGFACAGSDRNRMGGSAFPTLAAAVKDAIGRFGYPDVEAAYKVDTPPPLMISPVESLESPSNSRLPGTLDLVWRLEDRAVFLLPSSVKRAGKKVTGQAVWVGGVGLETKDQVYLLRDFKLDCGSEDFAQSTRAHWPSAGGYYIEAVPRPLSAIAVTEGSAESALRAAVCDGRGPMQRLETMSSLAGFVATATN
ncbi:MAG TPA: hypothetical protein VN157_13375 [Caulobacter sp.]|nr:hypothetical protein [Caulobacter sp.]